MPSDQIPETFCSSNGKKIKRRQVYFTNWYKNKYIECVLWSIVRLYFDNFEYRLSSLFTLGTSQQIPENNKGPLF